MGPFGDVFFLGGVWCGDNQMVSFETGFGFFGRFFKINLWKQIGEILAEIQFGAWKKNDFNSWRMEG